MPLKRTPPPSTAPTQSASQPDLSTSSLDTEYNIRKRKFDEVDEVKQFMSEMKTLFSNFEKHQNEKYAILQVTVNEIKDLNLSLKSTVEFVSDKYDNLMKEFTKLTAERKESLAYIKQLEEKVDTLERQAKSSCIELKNIPIRTNELKEDLTKIVMNAGVALNVSIDTRDIKDIYRIKTKSSSNRPICVEFSSALIKERFMKSVKTFNNTNKDNKLSSSKINLPGPDIPVYVAESLTPKAKRLFSLARDFSKSNNYKFCWTNHGRIFIRKIEGTAPHLINSEADFKGLTLED